MMANSLVVSGTAMGALVDTSFLKSPGKKNDAGETVVPALMPLQPAPTNVSAAKNASSMKFRFNFTRFSIN